MKTAMNSLLFHIDPASWLGLRLDTGTQEVCSIKQALQGECRPNKGEIFPDHLKAAVEQELMIIDRLPDDGMALRGDNVAKKWAAERGEDRQHSVDVLVAGKSCLLLVECKYKACPETQIVKSIEAFRFAVARKFAAAQDFLIQQRVTSLNSDLVVLFNAESKDKAISMFRRLQLQDDSEELSAYRLMDTTDFWRLYKESLTLEAALVDS